MGTLSNKARTKKHNFNFKEGVKFDGLNLTFTSISSLNNYVGKTLKMSYKDFYTKYIMETDDEQYCECGHENYFIPGLQYGFAETCERNECESYYKFLNARNKTDDLKPVISELDGMLCQNLLSLSNTFRAFGTNSKEYYDKYLKKDGEGSCKMCGAETSFTTIGAGYRDYCSDKCALDSGVVAKAVSERFKGPDREEKLALRKERYLESISLQTKERKQEIRDKRIATMSETASKQGLTLSEYQSSISRKSYQTFVETCEDLDEHKARAYGNRTASAKSTHRDYELFGESIRIQGYEHLVLDYLQQITTKDVVKSGGKTVGYINYSDDGVDRLYFPDIKVGDNMFIEVKSDFTLEQHIDQNFNKFKCAAEQGYDIVVAVPHRREARNGELDGYTKKLLDWVISIHASKDREMGKIYFVSTKRGSTTIESVSADEFTKEHLLAE